MVIFLVEELWMDIWTEAPFSYKDARVICDSKLVTSERAPIHNQPQQNASPWQDLI